MRQPCRCRIDIPVDATLCPPSTNLLNAQIVFCNLHAHAEAMRKALQYAVLDALTHQSEMAGLVGLPEWVENARTVLAQVEGKG